MVARSLMDLGDDEVQIGHLADAHAHFARAEQIYRDAGQTETLYWIALRTYQVRLAVAEGRFRDVAAMTSEALAMLDRRKILDSERALDLRIGLARAQARLGHAAQATQALRRLAQDSERTHGKDNLDLASISSALADIAVDAGRLAEARDAAERNLALVRKNASDGSFSVVQARVGVAHVLLAQGRAAQAIALVDQSDPAIVRAVGDQAPMLALARSTRGRALAALGRFAEAKPALDSALAMATRAGVDPEQRREIRVALDRALARSGGKPSVSAAAP